jgi:hypothetical protein
MTNEQEPASHRQFDKATVGTVLNKLGQPGEADWQPNFGSGTRVRLGESAALSLFPESGVIRYHSTRLRLELVQSGAIQITDDAVIIEATDAHAELRLTLAAVGPMDNGGCQPIEASACNETPTTTTLTGRIRGKAKDGRPDRKDKPTAWALMAVSEEGSDKPTLYSTTFHGYTRDVVLRLPLHAQVTASGYLHRRDGGRDTFSVVALYQYPGKKDAEAGNGD